MSFVTFDQFKVSLLKIRINFLHKKKKKKIDFTVGSKVPKKYHSHLKPGNKFVNVITFTLYWIMFLDVTLYIHTLIRLPD